MILGCVPLPTKHECRRCLTQYYLFISQVGYITRFISKVILRVDWRQMVERESQQKILTGIYFYKGIQSSEKYRIHFNLYNYYTPKIKYFKDQLTVQMINLVPWRAQPRKLLCTSAFGISVMIFGMCVCVCVWVGGEGNVSCFRLWFIAVPGNAAPGPVLTHFSARISRD